MPAGPVPDQFTDILPSTALGHLATIDEQGRPQVNPVRFRTQELLNQTDTGASIDPSPRRPYNAAAGLSLASLSSSRLVRPGWFAMTASTERRLVDDDPNNYA